MYGDKVTDSMNEAITETARRRKIQNKYNEEHGIVPQTIKKDIRDIITNNANADTKTKKKKSKKEIMKEIDSIEAEMRKAAKDLDFERAMELRDILFEMKTTL